MSHVVIVKTEVRDPESIAAACRRRSLPAPVKARHQLYQTAVVGWSVQLPDWRYPVVCQADTGKLYFDDFNGRWGDRRHLNAFLQAYAVERATLEARHQGHAVIEQVLPDGFIKLTVTVGGGL